MRILVLTNMYPPHHYGGYELLCDDAVTALRRAGHDVAVLTSDIEVSGVVTPTGLRGSSGATVRRDLQLYWHDHEVLRPSLRRCEQLERHNQSVMRRSIEEWEPDVVSVWNMGAMSLSLLTTCIERGLPLVHVVCDDWLVYAPLVDRWTRLWSRTGPIARLAERMLKLPCALPDLGENGTFCFISESTRRTAEAAGWRFPDATVTWSGISADDFPVDDTPPRSDWSWRLLHVGRIDDRKGIDTAIRALALLPDETVLEVLGRGDDDHRRDLNHLAKTLGVSDRVRFEFVDRDELAARYRAADVLLFPPRWNEPFGLVPIEAMSCSTPVIATATGGSSEFLLDEANCLRVAVDDEGSIARAVQRLADDVELRARLVAGGRLTAAELTVARWTDDLERWHRSVATGSERPPHRSPLSETLAPVEALATRSDHEH